MESVVEPNQTSKHKTIILIVDNRASTGGCERTDKFSQPDLRCSAFKCMIFDYLETEIDPMESRA